MTYETFTSELFERFPKLRAVWRTRFDYLKDEPPLPYVVFGSLLIPKLEEALETGNLGVILPICAFLEDTAEAGSKDPRLAELVRIEFGEWLGGAANESLRAPWLGKETKLLCRYIPGLATQRRELREERSKRTLKNRLSLFLRKLRKS